VAGPTRNLNHSADALVVALARTGDAEAFGELVRRKQAWVRNLMQRCCSDSVLADDLAQQTFLVAWTAIKKLREPRRFDGWLRQIAVTTWLKHIRAAPPTTQLTDTSLAVHSRTVQDHADIAIDLDAALGTLSSSERLCVVLAHHEGMSHQQISTLINMPLGTVKSHVRRGTQRLKTALAAYTSGEVE